MLHVFSRHVSFTDQEGTLVISGTSQDGRDIQWVTSWAQELLRHRSSSFHAPVLESEFVIEQLHRDSWKGLVFISTLSPAPNLVTYTLDIPGPIWVTVREKTSEGLALRVHF